MFGGQKPDASGVYRCLKTMEAKGLVASSWTLSDTGPAKRSYQLTPAGERCLQQWIRTLEHTATGSPCSKPPAKRWPSRLLSRPL